MISFISIILAFLSIILLFLENYFLGLSFSVFSFLFFLFKIKNQYGINSNYFLFLTFFGLYGYSVPISILFGLDIGWHKVAKFYLYDKIDPTLFSYLISNQLALLALLFSNEIFGKIKVKNKNVKNNNFNFYTLSVITALITSASELLNFIRVGGFSAIKKGKAFYQSSINDLVLNIPVEGYFYVAISFFALAFVRNEITKTDYKKIALFLASISFFVLVNILIVERGMLVFGMGILFFALTSHIKIVRIKTSMLLFVAFFYFLFNIMTILRVPDNHFTGVKDFYIDHGNMLGRLMNPSNTEFGAAAYNYRLYISEDFEYKYGATYLEIITSPIPTYIYPNKPKLISYVYRDKFNSERKDQGSIAGTGFSSLLEAYINFSYFGPLIVYFILGLVIVLFEKYRNTGSIFIDILYLLGFSLVMIFSRSQLSYIFLKLGFYIFQIISPLLIYQLYKNRTKIINAK